MMVAISWSVIHYKFFHQVSAQYLEVKLESTLWVQGLFSLDLIFFVNYKKGPKSCIAFYLQVLQPSLTFVGKARSLPYCGAHDYFIELHPRFFFQKQQQVGILSELNYSTIFLLLNGGCFLTLCHAKLECLSFTKNLRLD